MNDPDPTFPPQMPGAEPSVVTDGDPAAAKPKRRRAPRKASVAEVDVGAPDAAPVPTLSEIFGRTQAPTVLATTVMPAASEAPAMPVQPRVLAQTVGESAPAAVALATVQVSVAVRAALFAAAGVKRTGSVVLPPAAIATGRVGAGFKAKSTALAPAMEQAVRFAAAVVPAVAATVTNWFAVGVPTATPTKLSGDGVAV